jgi:hypothetical protein
MNRNASFVIELPKSICSLIRFRFTIKDNNYHFLQNDHLPTIFAQTHQSKDKMPTKICTEEFFGKISVIDIPRILSFTMRKLLLNRF